AAVREQLAKGLFNAFSDAGKVGDSERARVLITELLDLANRYAEEAVQEAAQRAVLTYGASLLALMRSGDTNRGKEGMRQIEAQMPGSLAAFVRPLRLAVDVLEKGEEQALAREPEEVRRVVRMLMEETG
ncbi:MAG: hypothetical protein LLG97_04535, partial [Deltaproteobacteria bacterium]|nr:hypothetical protein [Deltaproteobacteria bacterium]